MSEIYNNNYYLVVSGPTWNDAESNAINLGGHLVSINSQSENDFIVEKFKDNSGLTVVRNDGLPNYHFTYIGLYDDANCNSFGRIALLLIGQIGHPLIPTIMALVREVGLLK
tara:strand:- start:539 stop:874 length:336 start_codon:yes stop_codon:yes gene_type:complete